MMMQRRNPLADVSLAPYGAPQGIDIAPSPGYVPPPMNIEHAQFAPDDDSAGKAIGGIGAALLNRKKKPGGIGADGGADRSEMFLSSGLG